jgi:hypothetical protein
VTKKRNKPSSLKTGLNRAPVSGTEINHSRGPNCRRRNNNTETSARHAHDASNARSILRNAAIREQFNTVHV